MSILTSRGRVVNSPTEATLVSHCSEKILRLIDGRVVDGNTLPTIAVVRLKWGQVELFGSWQQTSSNGAKQVIKGTIGGHFGAESER